MEVALSPSLLVDDVLKGGNSTAATNVVKILMEVRGTEKFEEFLREMLPPDKTTLPWWTRMPLTRYSRRARQLRLSELLKLSKTLWLEARCAQNLALENDLEEGPIAIPTFILT